MSKVITRAEAIERLKAGGELERNDFTWTWFIRMGFDKSRAHNPQAPHAQQHLYLEARPPLKTG